MLLSTCQWQTKRSGVRNPVKSKESSRRSNAFTNLSMANEAQRSMESRELQRKYQAQQCFRQLANGKGVKKTRYPLMTEMKHCPGKTQKSRYKTKSRFNSLKKKQVKSPPKTTTTHHPDSSCAVSSDLSAWPI
jgi:hypothetical protein